MQRTAALWIRRPDHVQVLASPMRQRIIDRVEAMAPCTIRELAASLDVAADSLYYHVRQLEGIGLLDVETRRNGQGRPEAQLRARRYHIAYDLANPRNVRSVLSVGRTIVRQAQRDFVLGLRHPRANPRGPLRNLWALRLEASLKARDVRRINRHLAAILEVLRGAPRDGSQGLMAVSWVLAPIPSLSNGRRGPARPKETTIRGAKRSAR